MSKDNRVVKIALHGLNERSVKTMQLFLKGPCNGVAVVVDTDQAQVDLIDIDHPTAVDLLEDCRKRLPPRPIITMSLEAVKLEDTFHLIKPVNKERFINVLKQIATLQSPQSLSSNAEVAHENITVLTGSFDQGSSVQQLPSLGEKNQSRPPQNKVQKAEIATPAPSASPVNKPAFIGILANIDFSDVNQAKQACYNAADYFQGSVREAIDYASEQNTAVQLNSSWKKVVVSAHTKQVWLDADDKQLRAFAGLKISQTTRQITYKLMESDPQAGNGRAEHIQELEAFRWKLTIWTSRGRYPDSLDITKPVILKRWPNLTRLLVTPHALRIAALLVKQPHTMMDLAKNLSISPQYVFVFASACYELGLLVQAQRQMDTLIEPERIKSTPVTGLFQKILVKLRTSLPNEF